VRGREGFVRRVAAVALLTSIPPANTAALRFVLPDTPSLRLCSSLMA
jgi:hypothetical protein